MLNLDKFKLIELDFSKVKSSGQGFADEVFRVFTANHPDGVFDAMNASPSVGAMIHHAKNQED